MESMRSLARLGQRLQTAWQQRVQLRSERDAQWSYLTESWTQLLAKRKKLQTAEDRGFNHCLPSILEDYHWRLEGLAKRIKTLQEFREPPAQPPSLADWVRELETLRDEFGEIAVDDKHSILRVVTEPITLNEVYLGTFAIELVWTRLAQNRGSYCFDIVSPGNPTRPWGGMKSPTRTSMTANSAPAMPPCRSNGP